MNIILPIIITAIITGLVTKRTTVASWLVMTFMILVVIARYYSKN